MIAKIFSQFLVLVALFFGTFFVLKQVDWVGIFHVEEVSKKTEEKLGDLYWELIKTTNHEIKSEKVKNPVEELFLHLIEKNGLEDEDIKFHLVDNEQVNAFALPHGHLVVYSGLVKNCRNEAELMGVMGHEIAHITQKHVMKKLVKEVGLSVLISATTGGKGGTIIQQTLKTLSSTAYDRELESEADRISVDYLVSADVDPNPFADFLLRLSENEKDVPDQFFWISTHPESQKRAKAIRDIILDLDVEPKPVLSDSVWNGLKARVKENF
jgi:predicted Zn-dependent protease